MSAASDRIIELCKDRRTMKIQVAEAYADLLTEQSGGKAVVADVIAANRAIMARWSSGGLQDIKRAAWRKRRPSA